MRLTLKLIVGLMVTLTATAGYVILANDELLDMTRRMQQGTRFLQIALGVMALVILARLAKDLRSTDAIPVPVEQEDFPERGE